MKENQSSMRFSYEIPKTKRNTKLKRTKPGWSNSGRHAGSKSVSFLDKRPQRKRQKQTRSTVHAPQSFSLLEPRRNLFFKKNVWWWLHTLTSRIPLNHPSHSPLILHSYWNILPISLSRFHMLFLCGLLSRTRASCLNKKRHRRPFTGARLT